MSEITNYEELLRLKKAEKPLDETYIDEGRAFVTYATASLAAGTTYDLGIITGSTATNNIHISMGWFESA